MRSLVETRSGPWTPRLVVKQGDGVPLTPPTRSVPGSRWREGLAVGAGPAVDRLAGWWVPTGSGVLGDRVIA